MGKIDFLKSGNPSNKYNSHKDLAKNSSKMWRSFLHCFSWSTLIFLIAINILRISSYFEFSWLNEFDYVVFNLILFNLVILNRISSEKGLKNEKFWFWFLVSLIFLNSIWSLGVNEFSYLGIKDFNISLNYLLIIAGLFLLLVSKKGRLSEFTSDIARGENSSTNKKKIVKKRKKFTRLIKRGEVNVFAKLLFKKLLSKWKTKSTLIISLLILVTVVGGVLRFCNLGDEALYHDQLIQNAAMNGVLEHGKLAIYNPVTDELSRPYERAGLLTYSSAFLVKLFGNTEGVIKFPVAFMGTILIPLFYFFALRFVTPMFALLGSILIAFNPYLIYLSRFFRDYSPKVLFFFITTMLFSLIINEIQKKKVGKRIYILFIILVPFFYLSYHFGSAETTLLAITFIIISLFVTIFNVKNILRNKKTRRYLLIFGAIFIFIIVGAILFGHVNINSIQYIINTHLSFEDPTFSSDGEGYQHYLFAFNFTNIIYLLIFISGIFLFIAKKWQHIFIYIQVGLSFYIIAYLGDRYEDFRYISFLIPLAILTVAISFQIFWKLIGRIEANVFKKIVQIVFIVMLILIPTYFVPFSPPQAFDNFIALGQPWWQKDEGATYIHRRAVAPDYKKAGNYLSANADLENDLFIFTTSEYIYLEKIPANSFYVPRKTINLQYLSDSENKIFSQDLLTTYKCNNIWFVGTYVHLLNEELLNAFLYNSNAEFVGQEIGIMHYNYNGFYVDKQQLTWPTIIKIPSTCNSNL